MKSWTSDDLELLLNRLSGDVAEAIRDDADGAYCHFLEDLWWRTGQKLHALEATS